ncbi:Ppx/GppA phosphatase family protein [Ferviditalea candida]|uniref:Ppx/GppA phosphatase family protein n=1 Tax=Ferviditalea candida TaxID=3108399 RepID=A0ABU5ZE79_9BACL|nr:Ppx/GppA phosphatase family protein [Paenibacillaceae bacterium T2]
MKNQRIGIMDIGSNSIRLAIFEQTEFGAHRVIDESKETARLSMQIDDAGNLDKQAVLSVIDTLKHFKMLCQANRTAKIRAVATAAIRSAANSSEILRMIEEKTGLSIELLSGEEEARLGFLGMINTIDIKDGFLVDIGGGSTELTLFKKRGIVRSVSIPFGAVNTTKRFSQDGLVHPEQQKQLQETIELALKDHPWIVEHSGLPLVGVGGTVRSICKMDQKMKKYSYDHMHNYNMAPKDIAYLQNLLPPMPLDQRKRVEGLKKERVDIIGPGIIILNAVLKICEAPAFIVSGAGLRDGIMYETLYPDRPKVEDVLEHSLRNLLALHPSVPAAHVEQVNRIALTLFDHLQDVHCLNDRFRKYLYAASLLYRIGITINYYDYHKHTFYLMAHSRLDGLNHREILICAMIASFKSKSGVRRLYSLFKDILTEPDFNYIVLLGTLLQLARALDRSETQPVVHLEAAKKNEVLELRIQARHSPAVEMREIASLSSLFKKEWGVVPKITLS